MRTCVVKGCKSKSARGFSIRFHTFPVDAIRKKLWLSKINPKRSLKDGTTICELHFKPEDYDERNRLRHDAVPTEERKDYEQNCENQSEVDKICRICLASDRKVFDLRESRLKQAYSDVSGMTITPDDRLPCVLCWECTARVVSAARCQARARAAHALLEGLLRAHGAITPEAVNSVNRQANKLTTQLLHKNINANDHYIHISEDSLTETSDIKPINKVHVKNEIELDIEEFIDDTHDADEDIKDAIEDGPKDFDKENDEIKNEVFDGENDNADANDDELNEKVNDDVESKNKNATTDTSVRKQASKRKKVQRPKKNIKGKDKTKPESGNTEFIKDFTVTRINCADEIAALVRRKEKASYKNAIYKCEICYRGYMNEGNYKAHILKHTDNYGMFECEVCKKRYRTSALLQKHTKDFHSERYKCNKCPFLANNKSSARHHVKFHEGTKYQCPHCPRQFEIPTTYYSHLRLKHACDEVCEYCGHTFLNKYGARRHKKIVHKFDKDTMPLEGPYCAVCDVTFASQQAHDKHLIMSSKHRKEAESPHPITNAYRPPPSKNKYERKRNFGPIDCEQCGVTQRNKSVYAWHFKKEHPGLIRTQHPIVKPPIHMCEQCGRKFPTITLLEDHKWVHTGEKKFKCDRCDKTFSQKGTLVIHMGVHNATRPSYDCPICGKQFTFENNRTRHMFIHTGLKPFKCETCGKSFTTSGEQRAHVDHVHLKKPWPRRARATHQDPKPRQKFEDSMED